MSIYGVKGETCPGLYFSYPWETIIQATWRKYPNPFNPSVHGIDVIDRKVENGVLRSHRLITTKWGIPDWSKPVSIK